MKAFRGKKNLTGKCESLQVKNRSLRKRAVVHFDKIMR